MIVGAIPFGIIFGAVAVSSGLSAGGAAAMSAVVFAGAAQFISLGLIAAGANLPIIVLTTLIVNLRHALYSATLAHHLKGLPQRWYLPLGFWLTDESFVVAARYFEHAPVGPAKRWYLLGSEIFMYANWQLMTWIGVRAGQTMPDLRNWGLDFALVVTFIGILVPEIKSRPTLAAVLVAGSTAMLANNLPNQSGLLLAAIVGIGTGVFLESRAAAASGILA
ncbi:MAG: AzlC family ABC transporter permease [Chloroflexi bacterium]|nr:AzlC family ABC transporter permease [Chloroflexota bacterium]